MIPNKSNQMSHLINDNTKFSNTGFYDYAFESFQDKESLSSNIVISKKKNKVRSRRIDYGIFNYCSICELKYPKEILRCKDCNQKLRTRPWHRSKIIDRKRI